MANNTPKNPAARKEPAFLPAAESGLYLTEPETNRIMRPRFQSVIEKTTKRQIFATNRLSASPVFIRPFPDPEPEE
jgi:hypothetical protein